MISILLEGTKSGSRWREHGVLPYLDMTRFRCFVDLMNNMPDWTLFVVTPRDIEVIDRLDHIFDKSKIIFVPHNFDFVGDIPVRGSLPRETMCFTFEQKERLDIIGKEIRYARGKYFSDIKTAVDFFYTLIEE